MKNNRKTGIFKPFAIAHYSFSLSGILTLLILSFGLLSCSNDEDQTQDDPQSIRQQITENNEKINELNQEIARLETQLEQMGEVSNGRRRLAVSVFELEKQPFAHYLQVNSNVEAVTEATISPEVNGQIKQIPVSKGQQVQRGQVVVQLNTTVIENNIEEVKTNLELAETVYQRQKSLWDQKIGSEIQYLEAQNTLQSLKSRLQTLESQLDLAVIRSPINGVVDDIYAKEGELAMPGIPVIHIINLDQLYVNADVSESYLPVVNKGEEVILRFPAYPEYEQRVNIHRLGNVINPENRTFRLQVRIKNTNNQFKPNMVASIGIRSFFSEQALVIPSILVKQDTQGNYVYIATQEDTNGLVARKIYIEREMDSEGRTMIRSGLNEGDMIIRQGHNQVSDGDRLEVSAR